MTILAFGPLGPMEIGVIFVAILVLFGAKKIPEFAKGLGKATGEFKKAREEFEGEISRAEKSVREDKNEDKDKDA